MFSRSEILKKQLSVSNKEIDAFCKKWKITSLSLFGSILTKNFSNDSDVDVLIDFDENFSIGFFELVDLKDELELILGRSVDLLTRRGIESSQNSLRKEKILSTLEVIYGS